jgi:putative SOS response-associated peptidase YedK
VFVRSCGHCEVETSVQIRVQVAAVPNPADGYYEWLRRGKEKVLYLYEFDNGKLFLPAGLWESWTDPAVASAQPLQTFTLITSDASELASEIH